MSSRWRERRERRRRHSCDRIDERARCRPATSRCGERKRRRRRPRSSEAAFASVDEPLWGTKTTSKEEEEEKMEEEEEEQEEEETVRKAVV